MPSTTCFSFWLALGRWMRWLGRSLLNWTTHLCGLCVDLSVLLSLLFRNGLWSCRTSICSCSWCLAGLLLCSGPWIPMTAFFFACFLLSSALPWPLWKIIPLSSYCKRVAELLPWNRHREAAAASFGVTHMTVYTLPRTLKLIQKLNSKYLLHNSKQANRNY